MRLHVWIVLLLVLAVAPAPTLAQETLTNQHIITMKTGGLGDDVIIAAIRGATTVAFDNLGPEDLLSLKNDHELSDAVLTAMLEKRSASTVATISDSAVAANVIASGPVCVDQQPGAACWKELTTSPGCFVWNPNPRPGESVTWTGACRENMVAHGRGTLTWTWRGGGATAAGELQGDGELQDGKAHGHWRFRYRDGTVLDAEYTNGQLQGSWVEQQR